MGYVQVVAKQQLKRVLARGERELRTRAAVAEVNVILVRGDRQGKQWQVLVNYQVVVPAAQPVVARACYFHSLEPEFQLDRAGYDVAIRGRYEKYPRIRWRFASGYTCRTHANRAEGFASRRG